jgi:hypothetical protein
MKIVTKEIYKCDYCRKAYQIKRACEYHEKMCKKNPVNDRLCLHCNHFEKKDVEHYEYYGDNDHKVNLSVFYCKAKDIYLYPQQVEIKNNPKDFGETNEPMPKECDKLSTGWSL